jgi:hypothetical protein
MPHQKTYMPHKKFKKRHQRMFSVTSSMTSSFAPKRQNDEERQTQTPLLPQGSKSPLYSLSSGFCFHLSCSRVEVSLDDDIHVIEKVKGFILLPQCYCMKTQHRPNRMQIDIPTTND